ncbi:MAG TPA: type II toxin-antitoxin system prevent-host-death family antitoxin [Thermoanaerobaculia bacterium]|nr:type II toxin-antitoxin system prevent-host-death family antitoxin [Thermoanaerobaculia bacterium]
MARVYSTYEAKARLSELLDQVRKGNVVVITHRGKPVAEVRSIEAGEESLDERLDHLERRGILSRPVRRGLLKPLARRSGALRRFLESRE